MKKLVENKTFQAFEQVSTLIASNPSKVEWTLDRDSPFLCGLQQKILRQFFYTCGSKNEYYFKNR